MAGPAKLFAALRRTLRGPGPEVTGASKPEFASPSASSATLRDLLATRRLEIPLNEWLNSDNPSSRLDHLLALVELGRAGIHLGDDAKPSYFKCLDLLTDELVREVHQLGGDDALFRLNFLMMTSSEGDLRLFLGYLGDTLRFGRLFDSQPPRPLDPDNGKIPAGSILDRFAHNVMIPSLSRKLFNPGRREGYLVFGLLRPRVLVSLPFKGSSEYFYDVYKNSLDVATSLNVRGYFGSFLMLDSMDGMNQEIEGVPAWLLFFSLVAAHSDLVVFIADEHGQLTRSQERETELTPDRVPKKIVSLNKDELTWAKHDATEPGLDIQYLMEGGFVSKEAWMTMETATVMPLVENYRRGSFPDDRLIVIGDGSLIEVHPDGRRVERRRL